MIWRLPVLLAVAGVVADAATTQHCISTVPGCVEGNPAAGYLFELLGGLWPTALLVCLVLAAAGLPLWRRTLPTKLLVLVWLAFAAVAAQRGLVAWHNWNLG